MKRVNGIWYYNACSFIFTDGKIIKTSNWVPAGTLDRAILMAGGHR
jgi:hypothetical protein